MIAWQMCITRNKFCGILSRLAHFMVNLVSKKWPFSACFQDDRPHSSGRSPVCQVPVSDEGHFCSIAKGSNDCKRLFNKTSSTPWCLSIVHFEVEISRFWTLFQDVRLERAVASPKQAIYLPRQFPVRSATLPKLHAAHRPGVWDVPPGRDGRNLCSASRG